MDMLEYINEIKRQFVEVYGFPAVDGNPQGVPDGEYPMTIDGKLDKVRIKDDGVFCCNFD